MESFEGKIARKTNYAKSYVKKLQEEDNVNQSTVSLRQLPHL